MFIRSFLFLIGGQERWLSSSIEGREGSRSPSILTLRFRLITNHSDGCSSSLL